MIKFIPGPRAAAELRKRLGLACRRSPGPLPHYEPRAYAKIIAGSELPPAEHVDALLGALVDAHPEASVLDVCSWFDPGFLARELGPEAACAITKGASHVEK
jgi:hypothetical protein